MVYGKRPARVFREEAQGDLGLALPYHQVHDDQALVDNGPGRVAEAVRKRAEDLTHACLAGVGRDQNVLDIFRLGRGELASGALA